MARVMRQPTINKGVYSWGTTKYATAVQYMEPKINTSITDKDYDIKRNVKVLLPDDSLGVSGKTGGVIDSEMAKGRVIYRVNKNTFDKEYSIPSSKFKVPIPQTKDRLGGLMNEELSFLDIAKLILPTKPQGSADYNYWSNIVEILQKIEIIKKNRPLNSSEIVKEQQIVQIIQREQMNLGMVSQQAVGQVGQPQGPVGQPVTPATPQITPSQLSGADTRLKLIGRQLQNLAQNAAVAAPIGAAAVFVPPLFLSAIASLPLTDIRILNNLLSIPLNSVGSLTSNVLSSLGSTELAAVAVALTSGLAIRRYLRNRPPASQPWLQPPAISAPLPPPAGPAGPAGPVNPSVIPIQGINDQNYGNVGILGPDANDPYNMIDPNAAPNPWLTPFQGIGDPIYGITEGTSIEEQNLDRATQNLRNIVAEIEADVPPLEADVPPVSDVQLSEEEEITLERLKELIRSRSSEEIKIDLNDWESINNSRDFGNMYYLNKDVIKKILKEIDVRPTNNEKRNKQLLYDYIRGNNEHSEKLKDAVYSGILNKKANIKNIISGNIENAPTIKDEMDELEKRIRLEPNQRTRRVMIRDLVRLTES